MNRKMSLYQKIARSLCVVCLVLCTGQIVSQSRSSRPEEVEWTWEVRPQKVDASLPNVLLLGDSISRNYHPEAQRQLEGIANVYLFAASTSLGDPRLVQQIAEFGRMEHVSFAVIHFNNGMHGWAYSEDEYRAAFPAYLRSVHKLSLHAKLIWASTTPVKVESQPGPTNARILDRNRIAEEFIRKEGIVLDEQNELMTHHGDTYEDNVHFNPNGANIQGEQAAKLIRSELMK